MFMLIDKLFGNLNLRKQSRPVQILDLARLFMLPCLLEINTLSWAIERHLALLAATLRADASMHCQTEALFFSFFADGAAHAIVS